MTGLHSFYYRSVVVMVVVNNCNYDVMDYLIVSNFG